MRLFTGKPEGSCQTYLALHAADNDLTVAGREHCEDLWRDFEYHADKNYLDEFPIHFHQRWFEMYLTVSMIRAGYAVECWKPGPDILVTIEDQRIWIEATCATPGEPDRSASVPPPIFTTLEEGPIVTDKPINEMTLRISNRLDDKQNRFQRYIEDGIVSPNDMTVVAINIGEIPGAGADIEELMRRTLYGLGDIQLTLNKESGTVIDRGHVHQPGILKAGTDATIGMEPFVDGSLPHISTVLGSWENVFNLARNPGDGLILMPNVTADKEWPTGTIKLGEEWVADGDGKLLKTSHSI